MWPQHSSVCMFILFAGGWRDRWVDSTAKAAEQGKFELSAGKFYGDAEKDKGEYLTYKIVQFFVDSTITLQTFALLLEIP